jgi:hypothetical protein
MFCAPGLVFGVSEGVGSCFHVLRPRTRFRRYRGRRVPFSCFALPDSFSAIPRASGPVFMFCATGLILGVSMGDRSRFHILRPRTHFRRFRGLRVPFLVLRPRTHFRRFRGLRVSFSCFASPYSFSAVARASGPVFGGTEGVRSRFDVLRSRTPFHRCGGRRVPFSCFAPPDSFSAVPRTSGHVFKFCVPGHVFGGTEGAGSRFHLLRSRTRFRRCGGRQVPFSCFALSYSLSAFPRTLGHVS